MKKEKRKSDLKTQKSLDQLGKELFPIMNTETQKAWERYETIKLNVTLSPSEAIRYFEFWRGLSRMEAIVKKFFESQLNGLERDS